MAGDPTVNLNMDIITVYFAFNTFNSRHWNASVTGPRHSVWNPDTRRSVREARAAFRALVCRSAIKRCVCLGTKNARNESSEIIIDKLPFWARVGGPMKAGEETGGRAHRSHAMVVGWAHGFVRRRLGAPMMLCENWARPRAEEIMGGPHRVIEFNHGGSHGKWVAGVGGPMEQIELWAAPQDSWARPILKVGAPMGDGYGEWAAP
ncbi:hypothetical protein R3P38DRAFT_2812299 [Favolaschia claudopus]|uniref:Uncharacterized protein n=1 Tax=Favolaschia claudopus TaxID=2862362 RepID=A0AAV9Z6X1_9AGAR